MWAISTNIFQKLSQSYNFKANFDHGRNIDTKGRMYIPPTMQLQLLQCPKPS
jgi:hypothetical protein